MIGHTVLSLVLFANPAGSTTQHPAAKSQTRPTAERAHQPILSKAKQALADGDAKGALALLQPLRKDNAYDPQLILLVGDCQLKLERYKEAADSFSSIILKDPNHQQAWQGRSLALVAFGEGAKAESSAKKSPPIGPQRSQYASDIGSDLPTQKLSRRTQSTEDLGKADPTQTGRS